MVAHGFSKKKKKKTDNQKSNPRHGHVAGREIINQTLIQSVHEQKQNKLQYRGFLVFISKKKKPPMQSKPKPNPNKPNPRSHHRRLQTARRCRSSLIVTVAHSSSSPLALIADHKSLYSGSRCSDLGAPSLKVFLSLNLSLYLTEMQK